MSEGPKKGASRNQDEIKKNSYINIEQEIFRKKSISRNLHQGIY